MPESLRSRTRRWLFNLIPAYRGTGAWVTYLADDFREARIRLPLSLRTRNYVGTIFGGSMYAAVDPVYMLLLILTLGPEYVVWDKSASIRFRRPGRGTLRATFRLEDGELEAIRAALADPAVRSVDRTYAVELVSDDGTVHAVVEKIIHVSRRRERS